MINLRLNGVMSDDEDLASIAETSERDFMALQETPFTCQPYQVEMSETGYSGGPDMLQQKNTAPYSAGSRNRVVDRDRHNRLGTGGWGEGHDERGGGLGGGGVPHSLPVLSWC